MDKAIESLTPLHVVCALCVHVCAEMIKGSLGCCHGYRNLCLAVWQLWSKYMHQRSIQITLWSAYLAVCVHMCLVHVYLVMGKKCVPMRKTVFLWGNVLVPLRKTA